MADDEDLESTIEAAVQELARRAGESASPSFMTAAGGAARDLAEAYAWLTSPNQPH